MTQFKTGEGALTKVKKDVLLDLVDNKEVSPLSISELYFWTALLLWCNGQLSVSDIIGAQTLSRILKKKCDFWVHFISANGIL